MLKLKISNKNKIGLAGGFYSKKLLLNFQCTFEIQEQFI